MKNKITNIANIKDYELTFKVSGLSFLFTDMLAQGFKYLDSLFISDSKGQFYQYFTNNKMKYANKAGIRMFSSSTSFKEYQIDFTSFYKKNIILLDEIIKNKRLTKSDVLQFFKILSKFFTLYSKMDNQFTNGVYIRSENNLIIKKNLQLLAKFKDVARLWINNSSIEDNSQLSKFIEKISRKFEIEKSDLECYKISEIIQLFDGVSVAKKEIKNRKLSFTIYYQAGKQYYITGNKSANYASRVLSDKNILLGSEIKGQVANKVQEIVKGKVRVINVDYGNLDLLNKKINEMKKGEILVAEFTAPELMLACKKAKAIVTDIGGLLSHAAIVSRELNISCLVGTRNATKVLKTGDRVVIDFGGGVVGRV